MTMYEAVGDDALGYQCMDDRADSSMFHIDGIDFAPVGADGACGIDEAALTAGLQDRIHVAVKRVYDAVRAEGNTPDMRPSQLRSLSRGELLDRYHALRRQLNETMDELTKRWLDKEEDKNASYTTEAP